MEKRCETCAAWESIGDGEGLCRRRAPRPALGERDTGPEVSVWWPVTLADDSCGEWLHPPVEQPREPTPREPTPRERELEAEVETYKASLDVANRLYDGNTAELVRRAAELEAENARLALEVDRLGAERDRLLAARAGGG